MKIIMVVHILFRLWILYRYLEIIILWLKKFTKQNYLVATTTHHHHHCKHPPLPSKHYLHCPAINSPPAYTAPPRTKLRAPSFNMPPLPPQLVVPPSHAHINMTTLHHHLLQLLQTCHQWCAPLLQTWTYCSSNRRTMCKLLWTKTSRRRSCWTGFEGKWWRWVWAEYKRKRFFENKQDEKKRKSREAATTKPNCEFDLRFEWKIWFRIKGAMVFS